VSQWHVTRNGQQFGPMSLEDLRQQIASGAVTGSDLVWAEGMNEWAQAAAVPELFGPTPVAGVRPHRGAVILALGILGLVTCFILGVIAWSMANNDLRDMSAGMMDRSGEQLTKAGKVCGMVGTILGLISCCFGSLIASLSALRN